MWDRTILTPQIQKHNYNNNKKKQHKLRVMSIACTFMPGSDCTISAWFWHNQFLLLFMFVKDIKN